jgi:hypothetical protein
MAKCVIGSGIIARYGRARLLDRFALLAALLERHLNEATESVVHGLSRASWRGQGVYGGYLFSHCLKYKEKGGFCYSFPNWTACSQDG